MKRFIAFDPDQPLLLPVERFGGKPGFDPWMMSLVWIYAFMLGIRSSRRVARALVENVAFRVLANNQTPGHWALNRFRTRHKEALGNLLTQTVSIADALGLVKLESVAIDGKKIKAYASKHKAMSYGRMDGREASLKREIDAYFDAADEQDALEDEEYGPDGDAMSLPPELRDAQTRRETITEAKEELQKRAIARRSKEQEKRRRAAKEEGREYQPRGDAKHAKPKDSDQINFTDPESRIMLSGGAFVQAYNAQAVVDAGDHSQGNVKHVETLGSEALIPPDKIRHSAGRWRSAQQ